MVPTGAEVQPVHGFRALLDCVAEGLDAHDDRSSVEKAVARILERSPGAETQRSSLASRDSMTDVMTAVLEQTVA